jgi:hypothetical protein
MVQFINPILEKEKAQERFNICIKCDEFTKITTMCKQCKCIMKVKCKLKSAKCPLNKW